jgi:putative transposase
MRSQSKCDLETYINFLKATQTQYTCCELEKVAPDVLEMSHDSVNRWLLKRELPDQVIWDTVKDYAIYGDLVLDDTLLDKPQARKSDLVKVQYSGKHHGLVRGISIVTADWSNIDGSILPFGFKIYNKDDDNKTKNDLFLEILDTVEEKGLNPRYVQFDTWYASTKI